MPEVIVQSGRTRAAHAIIQMDVTRDPSTRCDGGDDRIEVRDGTAYVPPVATTGVVECDPSRLCHGCLEQLA